MVLKLKIRKVGDSLGVVLPKKVLAHLKVAEGDTLTVTEAQEGLRLSAGDSQFAKQMAIVESLNRRYRNALRELAT